MEWAVTNAAGITSPIAAVLADGLRANVTAIGDGDIWIRCISRNGKENPRIISQFRITAQGLGNPYLNPYAFISGGLYTRSNIALNNGNEKGVAPPPRPKPARSPLIM